MHILMCVRIKFHTQSTKRQIIKLNSKTNVFIISNHITKALLQVKNYYVAERDTIVPQKIDWWSALLEEVFINELILV
jgi:hypothetical protein